MPETVPLTVKVLRIFRLITLTFGSTSTTCSWKACCSPIEWTRGPSKGWAAAGVRHDPASGPNKSFRGHLEAAEREMPGDDARHGDWLSFARIWAEFNLLVCEIGARSSPDVTARVSGIRTQVDARFSQWLQRRFGSLLQLAGHAASNGAPHCALSRRQRDGAGRVALVVVDGLAFDQWLAVQPGNQPATSRVAIRRERCSPWVPTIHDCVSRQAIFAGKAPLYFPSSIYSTDREASLWQQFWVDHGLAGQRDRLSEGLGEPSTLQCASKRRCRRPSSK